MSFLPLHLKSKLQCYHSLLRTPLSLIHSIIANDEFVRRLFEIHQELCKSNKQVCSFRF